MKLKKVVPFTGEGKPPIPFLPVVDFSFMRSDRPEAVFLELSALAKSWGDGDFIAGALSLYLLFGG